MDSKPAQNIQDTFLNTVRKDKSPITIYLVSGVKLTGKIRSFDKYSVLLENNAQEQLIFKHAISTVVSGRPPRVWRLAQREPFRAGRPRRKPTTCNGNRQQLARRPVRLAQPLRNSHRQGVHQTRIQRQERIARRSSAISCVRVSELRGKALSLLLSSSPPTAFVPPASPSRHAPPLPFGVMRPQTLDQLDELPSHPVRPSLATSTSTPLSPSFRSWPVRPARPSRRS